MNALAKQGKYRMRSNEHTALCDGADEHWQDFPAMKNKIYSLQRRRGFILLGTESESESASTGPCRDQGSRVWWTVHVGQC